MYNITEITVVRITQHVGVCLYVSSQSFLSTGQVQQSPEPQVSVINGSPLSLNQTLLSKVPEKT